ncbi:S24/S26 family peptidase [Desulfurococcus amylolyticus]|uniref:S24/S26 family peptidase n=1 Tax=Desulfurococcus amylolyticus TaxID=94694 RepID=UPI00138A1322|nr:S24/S26 family peptidase [Desulfurococcus amylolyticus]
MNLILLLLFLGKLIFSPVALVVVTDDSMQPKLHRGDLVLLLATYLVNYAPGDVVLWCIDDLRSACCLHLLVNSSSEHVVTAGLSNSVPDTPVPKQLVYYKAVFSVPLLLWLPLVALLYAYNLHYFYRSYVLRVYSLRHPRDHILTGVIKDMIYVSMLVALVNSMFIGSAYIDQSPPQYNIPVVSLVSRSLDLSEGRAYVTLNTSVYLVRNASCSLDDKTPLEVEYVQVGELANITIHIPRDYFSKLWANASERKPPLTTPPASVYQSFGYNCTVHFDKGYLESAFIESFTWKEPEVYVKEWSILVITNPNPVNLNATIVIYDVSRTRIVSQFNVSINYLSSYSVDLRELVGEKGSYEVRIYYEFLGSLRVRGVRVDL